MSDKWVRVSKARRCPVCDHDNWCCIGEKWVNCMRTTSNLPCKNGGYLHPIGESKPSWVRVIEKPSPTIDAVKLMKKWLAKTNSRDYEHLAGILGVCVDSLLSLKCAWSGECNAWAWPMKNGSGETVGIRLRSESGRKWSVAGGREGIFLPDISVQTTVFIAEGPTDTSALVTLGRFAIGRPSCSGGISHLAATTARLGIRRAILIADNDSDKTMPNGNRWNPGIDGARRLADDIGIPCCIAVLPCKDVREFLNLGGTPTLLDSLTNSLVWHQPKLQTTTQ